MRNFGRVGVRFPDTSERSLYIRNVLLRRFWFATPLPLFAAKLPPKWKSKPFLLFFSSIRPSKRVFSFHSCSISLTFIRCPFNGGEKMKRNCVACEERILSLTYKSVELYLGYTTFLEVEVGSRRKREDRAESIDE